MKLIVFLLGLLIYGADSAYAETWFCAMKTDGLIEEVEELHVTSKCLEEPKSLFEKTYPEYSTSKSKYHCEYYILQNDNNTIIAERNYSSKNNYNSNEAYIDSLILDKSSGRILYNHMLTHLPEQDDIKSSSGTCKKAEE